MQMKIELTAVSGTIYAFVINMGGVVLGRGDGGSPVKVAVPLPSSRQEVQIITVGVPGSQYKTTVDLPGTANDFSVTTEMGGTIDVGRFMVGG